MTQALETAYKNCRRSSGQRCFQKDGTQIDAHCPAYLEGLRLDYEDFLSISIAEYIEKKKQVLKEFLALYIL